MSYATQQLVWTAKTLATHDSTDQHMNRMLALALVLVLVHATYSLHTNAV